MKKLLLSVIALYTFGAQAQQKVYTYDFDNTLDEQSSTGPALTKICTGNFVGENLPDYGINQHVYKFDNNCGLSFDDAAGFLASGSYTIELYFKMDGLTSWKRVIDFKDRTSDRGCYVLNGQMNFYNIATSSSPTPFNENEYSHYVITRDGATKNVLMYGDGNKFVTFNDASDDAVYGANKNLHFFQDDNVVKNEASPGSIALLKIYNYTVDSTTIKAIYNNLGGTLGVTNAKTSAESIRLYPNPAMNVLQVKLPATGIFSYTITDVSGKNMLMGKLDQQQNTIELANIQQGAYILHVTDNNGASINRRFAKL